MALRRGISGELVFRHGVAVECSFGWRGNHFAIASQAHELAVSGCLALAARLHRATVTMSAYIELTISVLANMLSRRLARRGGVKRIAATIYDDVRKALKDRLRDVNFLEMNV